jgi:hypothetical protein
MTRPICAAAIAASLLVAAPAGAAQTERVVVERHSDTYEFPIDCAEFGPFAFDNLVSGREHVRVIDVSARDGELLQTIFHINLRETDANSITGKALTLHGAIHETWDYRANTREIDGVVWKGNAPGEGNVVQDTGRIVMTLDTHEPLIVNGPHEAFFAGGIDQVVCGWLAQ